jgi:hypothetical protein
MHPLALAGLYGGDRRPPDVRELGEFHLGKPAALMADGQLNATVIDQNPDDNFLTFDATSDTTLKLVGTWLYDFSGFFSPVDNPDVATNKAKAGSSIPVKFSLGGDQGLDIFATGTNPTTNETFTYPTSTAMTCDSTDELDAIEETVTAGGSSLQYDAALDQYTYVWKTNKAWAGTCRQLVVKLADDTYYRAYFQFVK